MIIEIGFQNVPDGTVQMKTYEISESELIESDFGIRGKVKPSSLWKLNRFCKTPGWIIYMACRVSDDDYKRFKYLYRPYN
jgi:hypothetical protein